MKQLVFEVLGITMHMHCVCAATNPCLCASQEAEGGGWVPSVLSRQWVINDGVSCCGDVGMAAEQEWQAACVASIWTSYVLTHALLLHARPPHILVRTSNACTVLWFVRKSLDSVSQATEHYHLHLRVKC